VLHNCVTNKSSLVWAIVTSIWRPIWPDEVKKILFKNLSSRVIYRPKEVFLDTKANFEPGFALTIVGNTLNFEYLKNMFSSSHQIENFRILVKIELPIS
jgi:hypothetical protein